MKTTKKEQLVIEMSREELIGMLLWQHEIEIEGTTVKMGADKMYERESCNQVYPHEATKRNERYVKSQAKQKPVLASIEKFCESQNHGAIVVLTDGYCYDGLAAVTSMFLFTRKLSPGAISSLKNHFVERLSKLKAGEDKYILLEDPPVAIRTKRTKDD